MTEVKVTVADLINGDLLKPGTVVVLRTLEGLITDQGTIRAAGANGLGVVDYRTPTAWSRVVCKINSSGWRQVKLKDEKTSLYTLKQKYIQRKGGDAKEDKPPKRQKTVHKSHVPNTNHIPQQLQFITHPLQQQLNQQPHQLVVPIAIVTPPPKLLSQTDNDPSNPAASMVSTLPPQPQQTVVDVPPPAPSSSYMKFKLAPPTTKTKMLELLVYIEDPTMIPFMLNTTASSFDSLHYVLLESFPQYRQKQFDIGVWSDQWGEFVKPPPNWDQFPSKTKVIVKTFPFRWNAREYEPPNNAATTATSSSSSSSASSSASSTSSSPSPSNNTNNNNNIVGQPTNVTTPTGVTMLQQPVGVPTQQPQGVPNMGVVTSQGVNGLSQVVTVPSPNSAQNVQIGAPSNVVSLPLGSSPPPPSPPNYAVAEATAQT